MNVSQLISGLVLVIGGLFLVGLAVWHGFGGGSFVALIYGVPLFVLGLFILLNKREDYIEPIQRGVKGGKE